MYLPATNVPFYFTKYILNYENDFPTSFGCDSFQGSLFSFEKQK